MSSDINTLFAFPGTGLDTDSDLVTIQSGDSRFRKNVIISDDGNFNVIANTLGNTREPHTLPSGTNTVIGSVEDKENSAVIYFVQNTGHDSVIRYNSSSDTFTNILYDESLDFPTSDFINAGIIGNEEDQYLVWADGSFPKMINIQMAINYTASSGTPAYSSINDEIISLYKKPFIGNIGTSYFSDGTYSGNNLKRKIFQFSLRLKYYDGSFSTLSPYSEISVPEENMPNGRVTDEGSNNSLLVSFNIQNEPSIVSSYQLLYRIIDVGLGTPSSWYIYNNVPYTLKGLDSVAFRNDTSIGIISDADSIRLFDAVPDASSRVGIIDSNRAVLDVLQEGYDNVDYDDSDEWDVGLTPTETAIDPVNESGIRYSSSETIGESGSGFNTTETFDAITDTVSNDYFYIVSANQNTLGVPTNDYFYIESSFGFSASDTINDIITFINATGFPVTADKNGSDLRITITPATPTTTLVTISIDILSKTETFRSLKTQADYKFGIRYGYGGKLGTVQTNSDLEEKTLTFADLTANDTLYTVGMQMSINHTPPAGATDYQIVSFGNNIDNFQEYIVSYNRNDITDDASAFTMYSDGSSTIIKKDDIINRFKKAYNSSADYGIDYGFTFEAGDIVRFVGYSKSVDGIDDYDFTLFNEDLDFYIDTVTATEIKIGYSALKIIDDIRGSAVDTEILLIQILRRKETFDSVAREISDVYQISGGYHLGGSQSQTALLPALIDITDSYADTWKSKQVFMNQYNCADYGYTSYTQYSFGWMEKRNISLYYDSYPLFQGRPNAVNESSEARGYNKIRWGGKFIDDSNLNYMSRFDSEDEKDLDDRNGKITVINQVGDTLKVYQERKANSLYLKTTSSDDPNGTSTFVFSNDVMSDPRQGVLDYGCTHFTSYVKNVRDGYFFDLINGDVLQDTPGGIHSISEGVYKMHSYFKEKAKDILEYGKDNVQIHATFDDDLDMYIISFVVPLNTAHAINDTVGFHDPSKKWFTHFNLPTTNPLEYYGRLSGKTIVSFVKYLTTGSQLWLHNSNATRNNFWGEQFESEVWTHANDEPYLNKTYDSIEINSKGQWSCPDNDSIEINKPALMRSRLVSGKFKIQEGIFRSEFLRNALNAALVFVRNLLINGKLLRGREMTIKLKNTDTTEAQLETVLVKSSISK